MRMTREFFLSEWAPGGRGGGQFVVDLDALLTETRRAALEEAAALVSEIGADTMHSAVVQDFAAGIAGERLSAETKREHEVATKTIDVFSGAVSAAIRVLAGEKAP